VVDTLAGRTRRLAIDPQLHAHGWSRRWTPTPLRYGSAGVQLDQKPIPLLHRTRLRNRGPVSLAGVRITDGIRRGVIQLPTGA
jgi:hypothetical protein